MDTEEDDDLQVMGEETEKQRKSRPKLTRGMSFEIDVIEAEIDVKDEETVESKDLSLIPKRVSFKRMVSLVKAEVNVPLEDKLGTLNGKIETLAKKLDQLPKPSDSEVPTREIQAVLRKEKAEIAAIMANAASNNGDFLHF